MNGQALELPTNAYMGLFKEILDFFFLSHHVWCLELLFLTLEKTNEIMTPYPVNLTW